MKTKKNIIYCLIALAVFIQASANEKDEILYLSLPQACQLAIDSNLIIKNAKLSILKSKYLQSEFKSKLYPQLEGYSDLLNYYQIPKMMMPGELFGGTGQIAMEMGTKYDWSSGFRASMKLFDLSYLTSIKVANMEKKICDLGLIQKKEEIVYQLSQVYYLCLSTKYQKDYLNQNLQNTDHLLEILKAQNENGLARKIDYSKVMVTRNNLQTQIDNLSQLFNKQIGMLKYLMGINALNIIELTDTASLEISADSLALLIKKGNTQDDYNTLTDIKVLDNRIETIALNKKGLLKSYFPTLSGNGTFLFQGQQNEFNFFDGQSDRFFKVGYLGLSVSLPLFDGFEKHSKLLQYNVELQQLKNSRKNAIENIKKDYIDAVNQFNNSVTTIMRQKENIKIAEQDYSIGLAGFTQQTVLLSDLILSENSLTEARLSYVDSWLQLKNADLEVKKVKGELINKL